MFFRVFRLPFRAVLLIVRGDEYRKIEEMSIDSTSYKEVKSVSGWGSHRSLHTQRHGSVSRLDYELDRSD